ncbi:homing endonuclease [Durotheca rogersii]|uniref:homing endonuclease n=1 Tax=Durotheca rogersii TaxID=419775 RepID=UPI00221EC05E|nr:homing endonuclease [Durotheca rogersii]KAI5848985.1 homing endonuclease [Durotheca rogersii]
MLFLQKSKSYKTGIKVNLTFAIVLHQNDIVLLESRRLSLGGIGRISNLGRHAVQLRVRKTEELEILINFLDKYSLITQKLGDYLLFKQAFEIYSNKLHLTTEGLEKLVAIKTNMNKGILKGDYLIQLFPIVKSVPRPLVLNKRIENPG